MCPPHPPWQEGRILYTGIAAGGGGGTAPIYHSFPPRLGLGLLVSGPAHGFSTTCN